MVLDTAMVWGAAMVALAAGHLKMAYPRKLIVKPRPFNVQPRKLSVRPRSFNARRSPRQHRNVLRQHRVKNPFALSVPKHRANGVNSNSRPVKTCR
jgi:hypothetical protein